MSVNTKNRRRVNWRAVIAIGGVAAIGATLLTITLAAVAWFASQGQPETGGVSEFGYTFAHLGVMALTLINAALAFFLARASARLVILETALGERIESLIEVANDGNAAPKTGF